MSTNHSRLPNTTSESSRSAQPAAAPTADADIDLSLLEDSLRLSPWQRLVENNRALALVRMLEKARMLENG